MRPVPPIHILGPRQAQVDFVNELRRLQAVASAFALHEITGQTPELGGYECKELVFGFPATLAPSLEQLSNVFAHNLPMEN
jgi:hypothetical protein